MINLITIVLIFSCFLAGNVVAGGNCATEQCEKAGNIPDLPAEVESFVIQRDGCDHFRGEPWPEGNDPESKERREFIIQNINELCNGTDSRLMMLRNKYRHERMVIDLLNGYEERIEPSG